MAFAVPSRSLISRDDPSSPYRMIYYLSLYNAKLCVEGGTRERLSLFGSLCSKAFRIIQLVVTDALPTPGFGRDGTIEDPAPGQGLGSGQESVVRQHKMGENVGRRVLRSDKELPLLLATASFATAGIFGRFAKPRFVMFINGLSALSN